MRRLAKPLSASLFPESTPEGPKKRKKPVMLTARSRKYLEREGWVTALVERSVDVPKFVNGKPTGERWRNKFDCFGFADLVAVNVDVPGTTYIQVSDHSHGAERRGKVLGAPATPVILAAKNRIEVHTWKKIKPRGRPALWQLYLSVCVIDERTSKLVFQAPVEKLFREDGNPYYDPTF